MKVSASTWTVVRRAFAEFLTLPACIIFGFLLLAAGTYALDAAQAGWLEPIRRGLRSRLFADTGATSDLLGTIAGGIITVTSITISLLLLAVQQAADALTAQVYDQFLRRRHNQIYFGFFIGLSLYTLLTLATVTGTFTPVFGGTVALILMTFALCLLVVLLYTTIDQMRPVEVLETIHDLTVAAHRHHLRLVARTRRSSQERGRPRAVVEAASHGFVTAIDLDAMALALPSNRAGSEIRLLVSMGTYVASGDPIVEIVSPAAIQDEAELIDIVRGAICLERQRNITIDPTYGIEELTMIGWTAISTAKSNPDPGRLAVRILRDLLARWSREETRDDGEEPLPIVYTDRTFTQLMDSFESLAVVASESMQHQTLTEILHALTMMFGRLHPNERTRTEDLCLRSLSALGDHVLTKPLEEAVSRMAGTLRDAGHADAADAIEKAREQLSRSIGVLHSRSTRADHAGNR